jgi:endonuclease/exonuclease/phosphatase family metal-dependent hydrolase
MSRNMYVGADVDAVIAALATPDENDDILALVDAIQTFVMTDFPTRAAAMAREIARSGAQAVGLQEVSEVTIVLPPIPGLLDDGVNIDVHFLPLLLAELDDRGLDFEVAASIQNIVATPVLPFELPEGYGIRLVDYDVILIDADRVEVDEDSRYEKTFEANVGEVAEGVVLNRGWVMVDVSICDKTYTVVNTHLESGHDLPILTQIREWQAEEIVGTLAFMGVTGPTIVMGDLNDYPGTPMYQMLEGAGFTDLWSAKRGRSRGYTCCHEKDLSNRRARFDRRIDYIWTRGMGRGKPRAFIYRIGLLPWHRVVGPYGKLWPSDHAGLVGMLWPSRRHLVTN